MDWAYLVSAALLHAAMTQWAWTSEDIDRLWLIGLNILIIGGKIWAITDPSGATGIGMVVAILAVVAAYTGKVSATTPIFMNVLTLSGLLLAINGVTH